MLGYIIDSLKSIMSGWFARTLSLGGKEILLKAVALAMPVYAMSVFKLPKATCSSLSSAMADFWWNSVEEKRKIHWISWEKLCLAKENGGLGFRDIECFNQALLAKQAWRFIQFPNSLCARFIKSRYFCNDDFLLANLGTRPSFAWKSVLWGRDLLEKGISKMIGNGKSIRVWCDPWLNDGRFQIPLMKNILVNIDLRVSDLIEQRTGKWKMEEIEANFVQRDADIILMMKPVVTQNDYWVWKHIRSGDYVVKSGYWMANAEKNGDMIREASALPSINGLIDKIWDMKAPLKIRNYIWRAISNVIHVVDLLARKGISLDSRCQTCGLEGEDPNHVLFACTAARQIWALSNVPCPQFGFHPHSLYSNLSYILFLDNFKSVSQEIKRAIPWFLWMIWMNRNALCIEGKLFETVGTVNKVMSDSEEWYLGQEVNDEGQGQSIAMSQDNPCRWRKTFHSKST